MSEVLPPTFFLTEDHLQYAIVVTLLAALFITVLHLFLLKIMLHRHQLPFFDLPNKRDSATDAVTSVKRSEAVKVSYQMTNASVNLFFGLYGFYVCIFDEQGLFFATPRFQSSISNHVFGYEKFLSFAAIQVGYNMWSLPVGLLWVNEPAAMIAHHVFVIIVCSLTAYTNYGNRIHAPFFLGVYEISSVPLAVVNFLKVHKEWVEASVVRKAVRDLCKVCFALMFLGIRIVVGTPHILNVTRATFWSLTEICPMQNIPFIYRVWISMVLSAHVSLAALQYYWAVLIVRNLARMIPSGKGKKVEEKKE